MNNYVSPWMDEDLSIFRDAAVRFIEAEMVPNEVEWRKQQHVGKDIWLKAGSTGLLCADVSAEYGGAGGDFRYPHTDDQAAQVLVAFADRHILTYIWDSSAPKGSWQSASHVPLIHIFALVCHSGPEELNRWLSETHNVSQDYQKAFELAPARVKGIRLQINSQHTGTSAESYFGDISFRAAQ